MKRLVLKYFVLACLLTLAVLSAGAQQAVNTFTLGDSVFLLNGKPFQVISGEIHYPRVPREAWRQRLQMAKAMGLNTIGTYVFWNVHEPEKDKFSFSGNDDIAAFVKMAQEEGLWVILRPSPYVCAEWEFGGYPYWLQNEKGLVVRSKEPRYLAEYKKYILELGRQLAPLQVNRGGNILMIQVENEYGSYGSDKEYLAINRDMFIEAGFDGMLYTCDPAKDIAKGTLPGLLPAINGVMDPATIESTIRKHHNGKGPFIVAEWYPAWFDWWGEPHHTVSPEKYAAELDTLLAAGMSVNMYMFHGGTTRGFMNGANCYDTSFYEPQTSSYDYDAPLDEAGNATYKYQLFRSVIQKYTSSPLPEVPAAKRTIAIPALDLKQSVSLFNTLPKPVKAKSPLSFEKLGQAYGYVLYRTTVKNIASGMFAVNGLRDYALVFVNGKKQGVLDRMKKQDSLWLKLEPGTQTIDILVENMGRINFGPNLLKNEKGIIGNVSLNGKELLNWEMFSLPMTGVGSITYGKATNDQPVFRKAVFSLSETGDTYLDMSQWGKGCAWINGHHLGRYWEIGPQQTLYVPAEWLKKGENELVVFEMLKPSVDKLPALEKPVLDKLKK